MTRRPPAYAPHDAFVAPAAPGSRPLRLLGGILAIELLFTMGLSVIGGAIAALWPDGGALFFSGATSAGLLAQLFSFALLGLAVAFILRLMHGRDAATLFGPAHAALPGMVSALAGAPLLFLAIEILPPWPSGAAAAERRDPLIWALLLPLAMLALIVQTGAEEMFYRGYIQQQVAARYPRPLWMVVPNLFFAAAHWDSGTNGVESVQYFAWAFAFGLAASDLTARSGSLGPAIGFHLANNAYAFLFFGELGGPDSGLALFLFPVDTDLLSALDGPQQILTLPLLIEFIIVWLCWLAARVAIRR